MSFFGLLEGNLKDPWIIRESQRSMDHPETIVCSSPQNRLFSMFGGAIVEKLSISLCSAKGGFKKMAGTNVVKKLKKQTDMAFETL